MGCIHACSAPPTSSTSLADSSPEPETSSEAPDSTNAPGSVAPSTESSNKPNAGIIAGAVVGSLAGLAFLALAGFCVARRRRPTPDASPHHYPHRTLDYEPTEEVQIVVPYTTPTRALGDDIRQSETVNLLGSEDSESMSRHRATATKPPQEPVNQSYPSVPSGIAASNPVRRADDMDDDLLPPEYREAWSHRHSASLEDAAPVHRWEKAGTRAHDAVVSL